LLHIEVTVLYRLAELNAFTQTTLRLTFPLLKKKSIPHLFEETWNKSV